MESTVGYSIHFLVGFHGRGGTVLGGSISCLQVVALMVLDFGRVINLT